MSSNPNVGANNPYDPNYRDPAIFNQEIASLTDQIKQFESSIARWNTEKAEKEEKDGNVDELKKQLVAHEFSLRKLKMQKNMKVVEFENGTHAALAYYHANQHLL
jgi:ribosomal protein L29